MLQLVPQHHRDPLEQLVPKPRRGAGEDSTGACRVWLSPGDTGQTLETRGRPWRPKNSLSGHLLHMIMHPRPPQAHTNCSESCRSPCQGQELTQVPQCQSCVTSPGWGGRPPCLLEMAPRSPSAHVKHSVCTLLCSALGLRAHYTQAGIIYDLHTWQLCTHQGSFLPSLSLSLLSTDCIPLWQCLCCQQTPHNPLHQGPASMGRGEREDNCAGSARTRHRLTVSGQAPPESLPGCDGA